LDNTPKLRPRTLKEGQRCEVWLVSVATGERELVFASDNLLLEAPNWTHDGANLILNGAGKLWALDIGNGSIACVDITDIPDLNNDHVLAPNGQDIYLSANDGHIYRGDLAGGRAVRVTANDGWFHFLHGVSPDGQELAYVGLEAGDFLKPGQLFITPSDGGISSTIDVGSGHCDGPEYSPDGKWLYFNTETFTSLPGHAQIARVQIDGSGFEQLVASPTVDWFPHLSGNGRFGVYLRFPAGTTGHPADLPVELVAVSADDWTTPLHTWTLFGGQGTINVNSWSPNETYEMNL
jgi:TolB protein